MKGSSKLTSGKGAGFLPPGGYKPKSGVIDYKDPNTVKTIVSKDPLTGAGDRGSAFPRVGDNKGSHQYRSDQLRQLRRSKVASYLKYDY